LVRADAAHWRSSSLTIIVDLSGTGQVVEATGLNLCAA
jgi:hypothetical protein